MEKKKILEIISEGIKKLYGEEILEEVKNTIVVQYPKKEFGHYATSVAMVLVKYLKKKPSLIAEELRSYLKKIGCFSEVEVAGKGFVNMRIKADNIAKSLMVFENELSKTKGRNKRILLEYVSANPTGPLHIGHGRWAVVGSILANVLKYLGYDVHQEYYVNDYGNQIQNLKNTVKAIKEGLPLPENGYKGKYMEVFKEINTDPVDYFIEDHDRLLKKIKTNFDHFYKETSLYQNNKMDFILKEIKEKKVVYEKDGALWFKTTTYGDDKDRVVLKKNGDQTYFLSDVAYHGDKVKRKFDILINILGADHHGYVKRLEAIVAVFSDQKIMFHNVVGQLVSLFRSGKPVRMSKRTGEMVTLEEVVDEIGVDATRYYLASRSMDSPLDFDLDLAVKKSSDNFIYYIQYAHARICSLNNKLIENNIDISEYQWDYELIQSEDSDQIIVMLLRFNEVIEEIETSLQPYHLCNYLYELSSMFHRYYMKHKFIDMKNIKKTKSYLVYVSIIRKTIKKGLDLLGITALDKM